MKILFVAPKRPVFIDVFNALKRIKGHTVEWYSGVFHDLYSELKTGEIYFNPVDPANFESREIRKVKLADYAIAVIDQSPDPEEDWRLDFDGAARGTELVEVLNPRGVICIGTSRDGKYVDKLLNEGCVAAEPLAGFAKKLPALIKEAARIAQENRPVEDGMLALTLRQPWAMACFLAGKDHENRNWPTTVRGTVAIHVAAEQPEGTFEKGARFVRGVLRSQLNFNVRVPAYDKLPRGAIIGVVDIVDCVDNADSPWFEGPMAFKFANPRILHQPIPCEGKRRFFKVSASVEKRIQAQLAETDAIVAAVEGSSPKSRRKSV